MEIRIRKVTDLLAYRSCEVSCGVQSERAREQHARELALELQLERAAGSNGPVLLGAYVTAVYKDQTTSHRP